MKLFKHIALSFYLLILLISSAQSWAAEKKVQFLKIPAPSLSGSILENADTQRLQVHLPPSYFESDARYPVIYYFHGYGGTYTESKKLAGFRYKDLIKEGKAKEMIIVGVSGKKSFYVNSPVLGNWEDYVANDVVSYIDANYRTINKSSHRGVAGFSMGGFGAINIGLNRPDVFKHVFALSPGLFDKTGLSEAYAQWSAEGWDDFLEQYGAAFAPNIEGTDDKYWFEYDEKNPEVVALWESGFGNIEAEILAYKQKETKLDSIYIEYGNQDQFKWIVSGSQYLVKILEENDIEVQSFDHEGGHSISNLIGEHIVLFFNDAFVD